MSVARPTRALVALFLTLALTYLDADDEGVRVMARSGGTGEAADQASFIAALARSEALDAILVAPDGVGLVEAASRASCALAIEAVSETLPSGDARSAWRVLDPLTGETLASGVVEGPEPSARDLAEFWWIPVADAAEAALPRVKKTLVRVQGAPGAVVSGLGEEAGAALSAHAGVMHLSFTGSVSVGAMIQGAAAKHTVPVTLELGGKSPQIVFADADLDAALPFLVNAGIQNAGQTCSAASRILVERGIFDEVVSRMAARYRSLRVGAALSDLDVGPVISARQRDLIESYLTLARQDGLNIVAEATLAEGLSPVGYYVRPTLVADVPATHRLAQEEIFGPVQVVIPFDGEAEALRIANGTAFGLVAGVWTRDGSRALRLARKLKCGQVFVNNYGAGGGIELPFGGVKSSGHGREKGFAALYGFSTLKTVAIHHG